MTVALVHVNFAVCCVPRLARQRRPPADIANLSQIASLGNLPVVTSVKGTNASIRALSIAVNEIMLSQSVSWYSRSGQRT